MRKSYGAAEARMMPRLRRSRLLWPVLAAAAVAAALFVVLSPPEAPADGEVRGATRGGVTQTQWGPLEASDRAMVVAVRQAGLWETPAGQQAQQRASSLKVKEIANMISEQHVQLDADARAVGEKLGVLLPTEPNGAQKGWLQEMSTKIGDDYDRTFVMRLRAAHGKVLGVLAQVRAKTRNSEIRAFAERSTKFVTTHMQLLESTGLVNKKAL